MNKPDYKKITQVLNYIAEKNGGKVNYMKALKLLYFAERLHLREYGRLISDDTLVAMKNGTLGSQTKDIATLSDFLPHIVYKYAENKLKRDDNYSIEVNCKERDQLSETDVECVDKIIDYLGDNDQYKLAELTHKLPEWKKHQYEIEEEAIPVVDLDLLDLFKPTNDQLLDKIYSQSEMQLNLSRDLFSESLEHRLIDCNRLININIENLITLIDESSGSCNYPKLNNDLLRRVLEGVKVSRMVKPAIKETL